MLDSDMITIEYYSLATKEYFKIKIYLLRKIKLNPLIKAHLLLCNVN